MSPRKSTKSAGSNTFQVAILTGTEGKTGPVFNMDFQGSAEQLAAQFTGLLNNAKFVTVQSKDNPYASTIIRSDDVKFVDIHMEVSLAKEVEVGG